MRSIVTCSLLVLLLFGCRVYSSGVLKMGPDTYTLNIEAKNVREARRIAYEQGTQECAKSNREFLVKHWSQKENQGIFDLIFRCLPPGDPELAVRPNYEKEADIVIQNKGK